MSVFCERPAEVEAMVELETVLVERSARAVLADESDDRVEEIDDDGELAMVDVVVGFCDVVVVTVDGNECVVVVGGCVAGGDGALVVVVVVMRRALPGRRRARRPGRAARG